MVVGQISISAVSDIADGTDTQPENEFKSLPGFCRRFSENCDGCPLIAKSFRWVVLAGIPPPSEN